MQARRFGGREETIRPMAQPRIILVSLVALVVALGAAFVARGLAAPKRHVITTAAPAVVARPSLRVLTAKKDLAVGDVVGADSFSWQEWPADGLNPNFIVDGPSRVAPPTTEGKLAAAARGAAKVAGATLTGDMGPAAPLMGAVVRTAISAHEPIVASKLVRGGAGGVMAVTLDPGMRAMSVPITTESAAGGFILPGDHVDVVQTRKLDASAVTPGAPTVTASSVMRNVRVLAIDQNTHVDKGASVVGATGTLEVTSGQAELLVAARAQGDLTLVLRSYADAQGPSEVGYTAPQASVVHVFRSGQSTDVKVAR